MGYKRWVFITVVKKDKEYTRFRYSYHKWSLKSEAEYLTMMYIIYLVAGFFARHFSIKRCNIIYHILEGRIWSWENIYADSKWWSGDSKARSILLHWFQSSKNSFLCTPVSQSKTKSCLARVLSSSHPIIYFFCLYLCLNWFFHLLLQWFLDCFFLLLLSISASYSLSAPNPLLFAQTCDKIARPCQYLSLAFRHIRLCQL